MKVYFNGFNLYQQFSGCYDPIVENLIGCNFGALLDIQVKHAFSVLLVADGILLNSRKLQEKYPLENIVQIDCNEDTILALLQNGDIIKIGENTKIPRLVFDPADHIVRISCGSTFTVALSKFGYLFNIPNKLEFRNSNIIDIQTGREHGLLLENNGNVWSFGRGSRGQLGHGTLEDEIEPKLIEALTGVKIIAIATGGWHSCALSGDGVLYAWGWNSNGQLGLATNDRNKDSSVVAVMATPQFLDVDFNISQVACGVRHTVLLSDVGILYGCGWNKYKQLTNDNSQEDVNEVTELRDFSQETVKEVKCGNWNTIVICEN